MLPNEFLRKLEHKKETKYPVLLTWYDELNDEFVAYVTREKGKGNMLNQKHNWREFECNITLEELIALRDEISPEHLSPEQFDLIKRQIK